MKLILLCLAALAVASARGSVKYGLIFFEIRKNASSFAFLDIVLLCSELLTFFKSFFRGCFVRKVFGV